VCSSPQSIKINGGSIYSTEISNKAVLVPPTDADGDEDSIHRAKLTSNTYGDKGCQNAPTRGRAAAWLHRVLP
jgi:hypothetical protein